MRWRQRPTVQRSPLPAGQAIVSSASFVKTADSGSTGLPEWSRLREGSVIADPPDTVSDFRALLRRDGAPRGPAAINGHTGQRWRQVECGIASAATLVLRRVQAAVATAAAGTATLIGWDSEGAVPRGGDVR